MIRAVFFDLVGTLIHAAQPIGEQYAHWARRHGATAAEPHRLDQAFRRAMRSATSMTFQELTSIDTIARAERSWWRELVRNVIAECNLDRILGGDRFEAFFSDLFDHFTTRNAWVAYADAHQALRRLNERDVVVGLITNYDTRVYQVLDALQFSALLRSVTIPALAGAAKPDRAIFEHALRRHGLEAAEALYVGDEVGDDYQGADGAGMRAVLIDREGRQARTGLRTIPSLDALPELIR